ncbi:MAG: hypothetical protein K8U57_18940 [Planctomycetes bacterium]|nr:hypothetical protein [Planctomycetota bacterium]
MRRIFIVALLVIVGGTSQAEAGFLRSHPPAPTVVNGTSGRGSWAGVPGIGAPLPPSHTKAGSSPVVGSTHRTGLFVHPISGRTRYSTTTYDPTLGRFGKSSFRN